jgi:hypothetical protein
MAFGISQLENRDWTFKKNVSVYGDLSPISNKGRYRLVEYWHRRPALNSAIEAAGANPTQAEFAASQLANKDFEILGTNASVDDITFSSAFAGLQLQTDGADNDQVIVLPHLNANQTAWNEIKWGTENQVVWECILRIDASVASILIWAGLKLTNTPTIATDDDQVFFRFSTDDSDTTWHCISSIGGTDTNTSTSVSVSANTTYHLKIAIDSNRRATFYINDVARKTTSALTNDVDLIPYVGVQALAIAVKTIHLGPMAISRILYE